MWLRIRSKTLQARKVYIKDARIPENKKNNKVYAASAKSPNKTLNPFLSILWPRLLDLGLAQSTSTRIQNCNLCCTTTQSARRNTLGLIVMTEVRGQSTARTFLEMCPHRQDFLQHKKNLASFTPICPPRVDSSKGWLLTMAVQPKSGTWRTCAGSGSEFI